MQCSIFELWWNAGATLEVREVPAKDQRIPFLDTLMPIFDQDKDGVLNIDEMNRSLATMQSTALEKMLHMSSMGLYTLNASVARPSPSLPSPSVMLDSDGDS